MSNGLQMRESPSLIDFTSKPVRRAYGTQIANFLTPILQQFIGMALNEGPSQFDWKSNQARIDAMIEMLGKAGQPKVKETQTRARGYYGPQSKSIVAGEAAKRGFSSMLTKHLSSDPRTKKGREMVGTEEVILQELAHAIQDYTNTPAWQASRWGEQTTKEESIRNWVGQRMLRALPAMQHLQQGWNPNKKQSITDKLREWGMYQAGYSRPGAAEHEAHELMGPQLYKEYFEIFDRLMNPK